MWVELPEGEMVSLERPETYTVPGGPLYVTVTVQNGLQTPQPYFLMVLADGFPTSYLLNGQTYERYPLSLTPTATTLELELEPDFSLGLGRLDVLLFYDGDPQSDYHVTDYTILIPQPEQTRPQSLTAPVPAPQDIRESCSGGSYGAWLHRESELLQTGKRTLEATPGETLLLEAFTDAPGCYRTIALAGDWWTHVADWQANGGDMLQLPLTLPNSKGSFFTITIPLDVRPGDWQCMVSGKLEWS